MNEIDEKMEQALEFINNEEFTNAQKILNEIITQEPENIEALKNLGLCEINLDNPIEAIKNFQRAIDLNQDDASSLFYLASCLSKVGEKEKAVETFKLVIEKRPDYLDTYKSLAMLYVEFANYSEAIDLLNNALKNENIEKDYSFYYILATCYMLERKTDKGIFYLEKAIELNPTHLPIMNSLASLYMNNSEYDKALNILQRAYEIDENNALTIFNLGTLNQTIGNYQEALKYFQKSYQIDPSISMLTSLANCALKAGEYVTASTLYKNLVMLYPNNSEYRFSYAECLENMQEYKEALQNIDTLLTFDEKNVALVKRKGALLRKLNLCEESINILSQLLNRGKIDVEVYYNLAYNYVQLGDYDNAKEMFKKCITLEPNNPYAHKDLGVLYLKMNCYEWAVDEMNEAIKLESDVAEFHYSLGVSYLMLSKIEEGKNALLKSLELDQNDPDALAFLGYVYLIEHDYDKAQEVLQQALKIDSNNFLAKSHSAKFYFQLKKYKTAKEFLMDIVEKTKDDETMNMLAICNMELEEYSDAMGLFYKLSVKYPDNHILLTNLAKCEYKCDKKKEALEHIRKALMIFDDYAEALDLLKEINNGN